MKSNGTTIAVVAGLAAVLIGGAAYVMSQKDGAQEKVLGPSVAGTSETDARIAEAEARKREAELAADIRKRELEALDKPLGDRLLDFALDTSKSFLGGLGGSLKI